jgi:hypothetical protein
MKRALYFLLTIIFISACSPKVDPVQTAIAGTSIAQSTLDYLSQQQTQLAVANIQLTQSAMGILQQQTLSALVQTQSALEAQLIMQVSMGGTQTAIAMSAVPTPPLTPLANSTPIPAGVQPIASTGTDFTNAQVYSKGPAGYRKYMITIQIPKEAGPITGTYHLETAAKKFDCQMHKDYPNRLYCIGPSPRGGYHALRLYEDLGGGAILVFVTDIMLPVWTPTFVRPIPSGTQGGIEAGDVD